MSGDAGSTQAANSNVTNSTDSTVGATDSSKHIGHDTNEWKTVTIEPDYCNVGGTVPFDSYATLDNGLICSPDVIARGTEVYRQGDLYQGTQANAGAGIHSGVSQDAAQVRFLEGNSGVVVNNLPVIEQDRHALINTTPYGYSGAYSQTVTCAVPISSEQAMRNEVQYLSDYSQQINNELIPELNRQLNSLQEQYDNTSNWPWEDRDVKNSLSGQISRTKSSINNYQDTLIYNRARTSQLFNVLEPNGTFVSSQPSWNEQQAINRVIERQQRAIQNLENWRTGPVLAGPAMFANSHGAPIEVVANLRAAGEGLGMGAVGLRGSSIRGTNSLTLPVRGLTYQPKPLGTFIKPKVIDIPQGLTSQQFRLLAELAHGRAAELGLNGFPIVVQGSRASFTARLNSDIDLAIKVPQKTFDNFLLNTSKYSGVINPGTSKEKGLLHAIENGIIHRGEARLSSTGEAIKNVINGIKVDFSVIQQGGPFDNGTQITVPKNN